MKSNNMETMFEDDMRDFTRFCILCSEPCDNLKEYYSNGRLCEDCSEDEEDTTLSCDEDEEYDLDSLEKDCDCFYCAGILSSKFGRD